MPTQSTCQQTIIETLECRRTLSSVTLVGSTLKIIGDDLGAGDDNGDD